MNILQLTIRMESYCLHAQLPAFFLLALVGCSTGDDTGNGDDDGNGTSEAITNSSDRVFEVPLANPEDCPADPIINCTSDLSLCEDGSSYLLFTDIVNRGEYAQSGNRIVTNWEPGDVPPQIVFTIQGDGTLNDDLFGLTWQPVIEGNFDNFCRP